MYVGNTLIPPKDTIKQSGSEKRLTRWKLQREAQALLPEERVAFCKRRLQAPTVDILYSAKKQSAFYSGLMSCGSVWVCPLCAAKISEHRRVELEQAIACCKAKGGSVYLATYTIAHKYHDNLSTLLHAFLAARKKMKQGRAAQDLRKQFGILGTVSVREVTWSKQNGWHPHCHELIFFAREIDAEAYAKIVRERWYRSAETEGLSMNDHGFQLDKTDGAVADYIAKFGREPQQESWNVAVEVTKSHLKRGRDEEHLTPFAMLALIAQGNSELKPLFKEYAQWFKGKHQLVWSSGLRSLLVENSEEQSDLEVVETVEEEQEEMALLIQLTRNQWATILRADARGQLLEIAMSGDCHLIASFLEGISRGYCSDSLLLGDITSLASTSPKPKPLPNSLHQENNVSYQVDDLAQHIEPIRNCTQGVSPFIET